MRRVDFKTDNLRIVAFPIGGGIVPLLKSTALGARYIGWWNIIGHRENTDILIVYEKQTK